MNAFLLIVRAQKRLLWWVQMDILGQSSLLVGVISFALGFSVLARNVKNKLFLSFAILTTVVSAWALMFFINKISGAPYYRWHLFCNIWLAPAGLGFILVLVRIEDTLSRRLFTLSLIAAVSLSILLGLHLDGSPWILQSIHFLPALVFFQLVRLMWIDRILKRGFKRLPKLPTVGLARRNLIYIGGLLVLSSCVMDHVPFIGVAIPTAGNIGLALYLFFLSQAISQQRLLNFGTLFSRSIVLIAVAFTLTGVYLLLVGWIHNSPGLFFLNSFLASFLILMLLDPLRKVANFVTDRFTTQHHRRLQEVLREAQRNLAGVVDPDTLYEALLSTVEQALSPGWSAVYVLGSDGTRFRRVKKSGIDELNLDSGKAELVLRELLANHPILEHAEFLRQRGQLAILLDQILENEIDRSASRTDRKGLQELVESLHAMGINLIIPLFDRGKVLAFVAVRISAPPEPWGNNWGLLPIIYPYFEQASHTLRSMEVYVKQREKERLATLGEMAAGLAHEIRNPLGAIKGAAQFLDPTLDRPESQFLRVIIEETDRLNRTVTQFLDYSKPPLVEFKILDLSALVQKTTELMRPGLPKNLKFEFIKSAEPAWVTAAGEQLQQVVMNLIQNSGRALEKKSDGSALTRVSVEIQNRSLYAEVVLSVEDNGVGIKKENLDKIFIPFFTTSPSGTGLGLPISQKIVNSHNGRFEVLSEEGRFTRFSVILPFTPRELSKNS